MKTKFYLIFLMLVIMGAGARTMFRVAYYGATREHDFAPDNETAFLIALIIWFMAMMVCTILLLKAEKVPYRNFFIVLVSVGILAPVIYMRLTH